ncbi:MAG: Asp-tRNA(Asn)/Glu-tRNA(Gln) amidotransferase subunit GatC [Candidatus Shapirobacteria bacterium]|jgi:aspartyl-tRNA(Asn)/glutamyl-tRNA(Gln) amidotransferase subunit C
MDNSQTPQIDIDHVAKLARLKLTPEEKELYTSQLLPILEHIGHLSQVDVSQIVPTFQIGKTKNVLRPDEIKESLPQDKALGQANSQNGYFIVPQTIDK